jgi:hypothetical protein
MLWLISNIEGMTSDIAHLIVSDIIYSNQKVTAYQYKALTKQAQANILFSEEPIIETIKNQYKALGDKDFTFYKPSNFPKNPSLDNIIAHAFSSGTRTYKALQMLNYINSTGELQDSAPYEFKMAFAEYAKNKLISDQEKNSWFSWK